MHRAGAGDDQQRPAGILLQQPRRERRGRLVDGVADEARRPRPLSAAAGNTCTQQRVGRIAALDAGQVARAARGSAKSPPPRPPRRPSSAGNPSAAHSSRGSRIASRSSACQAAKRPLGTGADRRRICR